jgi:iron complex transport system substrate-binding protein
VCVLNRKDAKTAKDTAERDIEDVSAARVDNAIEVHRNIGPGLLKTVYPARLGYELERAGLEIRCEAPLANRYGEVRIKAGYRLDKPVDDRMIIAHATIDPLLRKHAAQLLTNLELSNRCPGFLLNGSVELMKNDIKPLVYESSVANFAP